MSAGFRARFLRAPGIIGELYRGVPHPVLFVVLYPVLVAAWVWVACQELRRLRTERRLVAMFGGSE